MNLAELNNLLKVSEWNCVEFKEARTDIPKSAFGTVSPFANSHSRRLGFAANQCGDVYKTTSSENTDKIKNEFLYVLHADAKVKYEVAVTEQKLDVDGKIKSKHTAHVDEEEETKTNGN